jgi:hypothetical protein
MLMSILVLGYGPAAQEFVKGIKASKFYKTTDLDVDKARIHVVQVEDNSDPKYSDLTTVHEMADGNVLRVIKDGTELTPNETPFGDDVYWLLESDGHDTVVELEEGDTKWLEELLPKLAKRGYSIHLTNPDLVLKMQAKLEEATAAGTTETGRRTSLVTHSVSTVLPNIQDLLLDIWQSKRQATSGSAADELAISKEGEPCGTEDSVPWNNL